MIESKTRLIAAVAVMLAAVAFGGGPKEGETVHLQDRDVYVRGPNYDKSAIGTRLGYVRRSEGHGMSAHDWKWMMDFADRALGL